jgi:hypothetical protein
LSSLSGGFPERYRPVGKKKFVADWPTVNLSIRKDIFQSLGGFQEFIGRAKTPNWVLIFSPKKISGFFMIRNLLFITIGEKASSSIFSRLAATVFIGIFCQKIP